MRRLGAIGKLNWIAMGALALLIAVSLLSQRNADFYTEKDFYDRHGVPAVTVGHPLADRLPTDLDPLVERRRLGLDHERVVAILPGSRSGEVTRLGPVFVATARRLADRFPDLGFVAPMANAQARRIFSEQVGDEGVESLIRLTDGDAPGAIVAADVVLLASGTASLQAALLERPIVSAYRVAPLTYYLARLFRLLKVAHFTMPNLLTKKPMVPEFLQDDATPEALEAAVGELLVDPSRRAEISAAFAELRGRLALGADQRAADAVIELAGRPRMP